MQRLARLLRAELFEHVDGSRQAIDDVRVSLYLPFDGRVGEPLTHLVLDAKPVLAADQRHDHVHHSLPAAVCPALHGAEQPATEVVQEALGATLQVRVLGLVIDRLGAPLLLGRLERAPLLGAPASCRRLPRLQRCARALALGRKL